VISLDKSLDLVAHKHGVGWRDAHSANLWALYPRTESQRAGTRAEPQDRCLISRSDTPTYLFSGGKKYINITDKNWPEKKVSGSSGSSNKVQLSGTYEPFVSRNSEVLPEEINHFGGLNIFVSEQEEFFYLTTKLR